MIALRRFPASPPKNRQRRGPFMLEPPLARSPNLQTGAVRVFSARVIHTRSPWLMPGCDLSLEYRRGGSERPADTDL
jgi:hypothetical protein